MWCVCADDSFGRLCSLFVVVRSLQLLCPSSIPRACSVYVLLSFSVVVSVSCYLYSSCYVVFPARYCMLALYVRRARAYVASLSMLVVLPLPVALARYFEVGLECAIDVVGAFSASAVFSVSVSVCVVQWLLSMCLGFSRLLFI